MNGRLDFRICPPNKCPILNTQLSGGQILKALPLGSPVKTDKTETWSSANILDTSFPMVDLKLTCRNAFY